MKGSLRTRLFWGQVGLFLAASVISILIAWKELHSQGVTQNGDGANWRLILTAAAVSCAPVVLLAIASWWLTRRSLSPIVTLTQAAEHIHEDSLHKQIPLTGNGDELDRLASVLNDMMARLDASFQKVREFTLHASHELKTPLTILKDGFEKALADENLSEAQRDRLFVWLDEAERLNHIVSGLTLLTQGDAHQVKLSLESLDLAELVTDAASEASILGQLQDLKVNVIAPEPCHVLVDRHRLRQLLLNLTDNAVKYNRDKGYVEYTLLRNATHAKVTVRSGGRGIDAEELPKIFDRFFRSGTSRGTVSDGCGLGLSIARWIAEEHGGTLTAESAPDNTALILQLPLPPENQPTKSATNGVKSALTKASVMLLSLLWATAASALEPAAPSASVSYNYEVRPILSGKCFACHGSDAGNRKGDLRLDQREAALASKAIVPGQAIASSLVERISTKDADDIMPPPEKHDALSEAEKSILIRWINQGAPYETHWAFVPPVVPDVPRKDEHPIDAFIQEALAARDWQSSPEAEPEELLRRVTLALTGLTPTVDEIKAFTGDSSPNAYERAVDRLLDSPHYGERLAASWLDAARYADTYGRHEDADSLMWPWRDWVIKAFNENLPYDEFLRWQMAGDLMPHATQEQKIATAFHRLAVQSNESGSDPEEFRWDQVFDRVNTTATAVLGLTMECARCHDHKYDPISAKEYYQMAAFFDKIDELGLFSRYTNGIPAPSTFVYQPGEEARHQALKKAVADAEAAWQHAKDTASERYRAWLKHHAPPGRGEGLWHEWSSPNVNVRMEALMPQPEVYVSFDLVQNEKRVYVADSDPGQLLSGAVSSKEETLGKFGRACGFRSDNPKKYAVPPQLAHYRQWQPFTFSLWFQAENTPERGVILHRSRAGLDAANRGYELTFEDGKLTATLAHFYPGNAIRIQAEEKMEFKAWRHVAVTYDGSSRAAGLSLFIDGQPIPTKVVRDHLYRDIDYLPEWGDLDNVKVADADAGNAISLKIGGRTLDTGLRGAAVDELRAYDRQLSPVEVAYLMHGGAASDDAPWAQWYMREVDADCRSALALLTAARRAESEFSTALREMMVMDESHGPKRETTMLNRGDFKQPGAAVQPGTPAVLIPFSTNASRDRRGLAEWLTDPRHPLTSRVEVNRIWALFFGRGLVATPQDFGLQGSVPSHPKLLDWLALHFVESGWDIKALCREIALSRTFRQSSIPADTALRRQDPDNIYLGRGPSFRLSAEQLRDSALTASGLLIPAIGGPSVKPYQPAGIWEDNGTQHVYEQDKGDNLHRRSLYTFWRRTSPPPVMNIFDAPTREFCLVKRQPTLTPLQALALLNDTGFLEAARVLGEKLVRDYPAAAQDADRVEMAFLHLAGKPPSEHQKQALAQLISESRSYFVSQPTDAAKILDATGEAPRVPGLPPAEVAATLMMTRAVLSSDPFVTSH